MKRNGGADETRTRRDSSNSQSIDELYQAAKKEAEPEICGQLYLALALLLFLFRTKSDTTAVCAARFSLITAWV
jgi:hypothetical protein